ncbi:MAG: hypothetical protein ACJA01_004501 [Saprospiraceae bacterium]|jgi:uncharacterized protein YbaP (TraB family)
MNLIKISLGLSIALLFSLFACKSAEKIVSEEIVKVPEAKSLIWKISGKELTTPSYLFGTIHIIDGDDFFLPKGTLSAFDVSDKIVFEIDMADMNDPMKLMPMMQKAFMAGDTTLEDLLTVDEYAMVKEHFSKMGLPIFFLERIKPMFLTVFATGDFDPEDLKSGKVKSYEMEFAAMAEDASKETAGLETIEYQIGIFDAVPYSDQAAMLLDAINSSDTEGDQFQELVDMYKQQDIEGLYNMMKGDETVAAYEDALLINRNKNWIPQMSTMMSVGPTFFAVGAGHLGGPMGVVNLLREEGYAVLPYKG